jgi:type VI secretion system protein ImpA
MPLDLAALLRPIDGDAPCGPDLSFSNEFDALRELRREDDPTLDQGEWVAERKRADWPGVMALCERLLIEQTKDVRLAGWYADAAVRVEGYAGLADGLSLYAALLREHWDGVHPQPDGSDQELRIGSIVWLLAQVQAHARRVPVLRGTDRSYTLAEIEAAGAQGSAEAGADPAADDLQRARRKTPPAELQASVEKARGVLEALAALQTEADARLGDDGPAFVAAREAVADAVSALERLLRERGGAAPAPGGTAAPAAPAVASGGAGFAPGLPTSREQALAQLRLVADYFRRSEPHSPVAYLAERAAAWGEMPLHAWLRTVMKDGATLAQLEELLGVAPPAADNN